MRSFIATQFRRHSIAFTVGLAAGGLVTRALTEANRDPASQSAEKSAPPVIDSARTFEQLPERVNIASFYRNDSGIKLVKPEVRTAITSIYRKNAKGDERGQLIGSHIRRIKDELPFWTGLELSTDMLTIYWDGSDDNRDNILAVDILLPEFIINRIGRP